jgi:hypothetical protein
MIDPIFEPFRNAIRDFHRVAPDGTRPRIIYAGMQEYAMYIGWRKEHPAPPAWPPGSDDVDRTWGVVVGPRYQGLTVELTGRPARVSVAGETPNGDVFEYPPDG